MNKTETPTIRLVLGGLGSLILLSDIVFPLFLSFGRIYGRLIPAALCTFILVILAPVAVRGSSRNRFFAVSLAILPAVLLVFSIVASSRELLDQR
jgi:hypothetical protein